MMIDMAEDSTPYDDPQQDETELSPSETSTEHAYAWALDGGDDDTEAYEADHTTRWLGLYVGVAAVAVAIATVVLCFVLLHHRGGPMHAAAAPTANPPLSARPPAPPPILDGTYKLTFYPAREVFHGRTPRNAPPDSTPFSSWWAFRSACPPEGCVAAATSLDDNDHQAPAANHRQWVFDFLDGAWQQATAETVKQPCLDNTSETTWISMSLTPQPDGTLDGIETSTITTDDCGMFGNTLETPFTATRVADTPEVAVAPPASPPAMTPLPKVPKLPEQRISEQDEQFIAQLADHGVPTTAFPNGAESEIVNAHVTCEVKHHGFALDQQPAVLRQTPDGKALTQEQAEWFVRLAVSTYCP